MEVLSSRVLLHPRDRAVSRAFYRDVLGLAVYREFGPAADPGTVFFLGSGFLEISGGAPRGPETTPPAPADGRDPAALWLQVRDVQAEYHRLVAAGLELSPPRQEPWGLVELWLSDPDGTPIVCVQVPDDHPLRRDSRSG